MSNVRLMTPEQIKIVEDNHNLIYFYIQRYLYGDIDTWYDIMAIALCKAAMNYDETKGIKFSNYAIKIMKNEYLMEIRKLNTLKRENEKTSISLQMDTVDEGKGTLEDIIPDHSTDVESVCVNLLALSNLLDTMKSKEKDTIIMNLLGYDQKEISRELHISQGHVSRILKSFRDRYSKL